jgi:hypothetical protein
MSSRYGFIEINAQKRPETIFEELRDRIAKLNIRKVNGARPPIVAGSQKDRRIAIA